MASRPPHCFRIKNPKTRASGCMLPFEFDHRANNMDECQDGHPENLIMPLLLTAHPQQVSHSTAEHANKLTNLD